MRFHVQEIFIYVASVKVCHFKDGPQVTSSTTSLKNNLISGRNLYG